MQAPRFGLIHNPARGRQSFALDLLEPLRPQAEAFALDLLASRTFRKSEFVETPEGHVRMLAPLTHELAATLPRWAELLAPWAERCSHAFGLAMDGKYHAPAPLTGRKRRDAQAAVKARKAATKTAASSTTSRQRPSADTALPLWSCPDCGGAVTNSDHVRCESCLAADPQQTPAVRKKRGRAIAARKRAIREWEEAHPGTTHDPNYFQREVLPRLARVKLAQIMEAAGVSKGFASDVRRGRYPPHVSTWAALAELVQAPPLREGSEDRRGGML